MLIKLFLVLLQLKIPITLNGLRCQTLEILSVTAVLELTSLQTGLLIPATRVE